MDPGTLRETRIPFEHLLVVLVLSLTLPVYGQQRDITFERVTTDESASLSGIRTMLLDSQGFLWLATSTGLSQYDGYQFTSYTNTPLDSISLSNNWVQTIYEDRAGNIWAGTRGGGLDRLDALTRTFSHYKKEEGNPHSLSDNNVNALFEDRTGTFWVGTEFGGLNKMDRSTGRFISYRHEEDKALSLSSNTVYSIYEDRSGTLWIGTRHGLDQFDRATGAFTHFEFDTDSPTPRDVPVYQIYEEGEGLFLIGTGYGLVRLDPTTGHFRFYESTVASDRDQAIFAIHEDRAGVFLIGSVYGLEHFDPTTARLTPISLEATASKKEYVVTAIHEDPSGVLWIGTEDGGLYRADRSQEQFAHYKHEPDSPQSLSNAHVKALYEDRSGNLWIGTRNGLNRLDRATGAITQYNHESDNPRSISGSTITHLFEDQRGRLWVVAYDAGINRLDSTTETFTRYTLEPGNPNSLSSKIVRAVYESPAEPGVLWVGTKKGLDRLEVATRRVDHYRHDDADATSLGHNSIRTIYEDRAGMLWIGTDGGLNRFDRTTGTFIRYAHEQDNPYSLSYNEVRSIYEDQAGTLWIGLKGGLNKFVREEERFVWYTEEDGIPGANILGFADGEHGAFWLCGSRGIAKVDPTTAAFRLYDHEDGLINTLFEYNACLRSRSGHLFAGGNNGVDVFHPDSLQDNPHIPPIVFIDFKKRGQSTSFDTAIHAVEEITLSHTDNFFSFEFAALDYRNPSSNQYAYQLQGLDADWVYAGTRRLANYTDVDPGDYVFRVKGSNNDGLWNEEGIAVRVIITPPWWQRWWFRLFMFFSLVSLLVAGYQGRTRSIRARNQALQADIAERKKAEEEREALIADLEQRNAEMERFTYTVSHDLKTPLVTIKGFLGLIEKDLARGDTHRMIQDVAQISTAADIMNRLLSEVLDLSRIGRQVNPPEPVALGDVVHEALALVAGPIQERGVTVERASAMPTVFGDRVRLLEVYQNLIDNAVKFMGDQTTPWVEIAARVNGEEVLCSVRDNGMGIGPEYHEQVFGLFNRLDAQAEGTGIGLALVKRTVEVHGGRIWVESEGEGRGSTFWFTLPRNGA